MKYTVKKTKPSKKEEPKGIPLTAKDLKEYTKLIADIGKLKKRGFIIIFEVVESGLKNGKPIFKANGLSFSNNVPRPVAVNAIVSSASISVADLILLNKARMENVVTDETIINKGNK